MNFQLSLIARSHFEGGDLPLLVRVPEKIIQVGNFIKGQWHFDESRRIEIISPYFGKVVGLASAATSNQVSSAIDYADEAAKVWGRTPIKERSACLFVFRNLLLAEIDKIAEMICLESGKIFSEARAEVLKGVEVLEFALSQQNADMGGRIEVSRGVFCEYRRRPLGVVANITPFNFPAMVPMWTIPNVLVSGNAYVWKPSDKTPLTSLLISDLLKKSGLPDGLFTVLQGGADVVNAIISHEKVKAIGFVGSTAVARQVYLLGTSLGKRVLALGGAKNHVVLLPDADVELAGRGISDSFTGCAGQRCMAASVLLAVGDCEKHIEVIKKRAASLVLGKDMGAIVTSRQRAFLLDAITKAEKDGARVILDGRNSRPENTEYHNGNWIGPTILDHVQPGSMAACDELFGPILSIIRCRNISEALSIENKNIYGNACSVFTSSGPLAEKVVQAANAGMVGINVGVPVPREPFSFGGINQSKFGHGDITGASSLDLWTDLKKITTKWETQQDSNWMS